MGDEPKGRGDGMKVAHLVVGIVYPLSAGIDNILKAIEFIMSHVAV